MKGSLLPGGLFCAEGAPRTDGGGLVEVGAGEHRGGVHAGPAPEHDALEAGVAVQALLRLLVGLLVVAVLGLRALRLVDRQVTSCTYVIVSCMACPGVKCAWAKLQLHCKALGSDGFASLLHKFTRIKLGTFWY